jgi:hypothetical protein
MGHALKMMQCEPEYFREETVGGRWGDVGQSRELPHRRKWVLVENGHESLAGIIDTPVNVG